MSHRAPFPAMLDRATFDGATAEEHVLVSAYADLLRDHGWSVRELPGQRARLRHSSAACPACFAATEPFQAEGKVDWRFPSCGRRTHGTAAPDHALELPSYGDRGEDVKDGI
ncbi:hypothetical protein ACFWJT_05820 [Streptomyces sp. NPDC127069]|uniref:hypothetical protein n=1 Tax=Streptomyces sp. NPDC127069 TaxID=3347128 RepID=UPI0036666A6E